MRLGQQRHTNIMIVIKKYINIILSLCLLAFYMLLAWLIHRTGFEHSEALFMAEKTKILFESDNNTLLTLGTTFPTVTFISSIIFSPFGNLFAPILASSSFLVLLFFFLLNDFEKSKLPKRVYITITVLIFVFHPGFIYAAISGRSVGAILMFFYLVFRSLFNFYRTQISYYLSMASIYLSFLVFCDHNFIWLILSFFPFIVLVSIEGLKLSKAPPILQYFESVNTPSQRRKLTNRTLALYVIIFLLPIGALFLFRTLNYYHAGDSTYFLTSQYANWHATGNISIAELVNSSKIDNVIQQIQLVFQVYVLILTPLLVLVFLFFRGRMYELFTLIAPFLLLSILLLDDQFYITVEFYLIFIILAFIGLCFYGGVKYKHKLWWPIIIGASVMNIFTGVIYFNRTSDPEESYFFTSLKKVRHLQSERSTNEEIKVATFISNLATPSSRILIDDASAYKIMAHLRSLKSVIMPINDNFLTVVENPKLSATYICVAKETNKLKNYTVLNYFNLNKQEQQNLFIPVLMFETTNWAVYKIEPPRIASSR